MKNFIKHIVGFASLEAWMFIFFGIVCAVFVFGILMMIFKKKEFPIGASTAVATVLSAIAVLLIGQILVNPDYLYFNLFIVGSGAVLSVAGGVISTVMSKKRKKEKCAAPVAAPPAPIPVNDYATEPAPFAYAPGSVRAAPAPNTGGNRNMQQIDADIDEPVPAPYAVGYGPISPASPEVDALLNKINMICANGAPLTEMRETAMRLQSERAKPENKNNPETNGKLNKALLDLLNVIHKR